jgi:hypothetical protein
MRRRTSVRTAAVALAAGALLASASAVAAKGPTCSDFEALSITVHAQHVIRDYVSGGALGQEWPPRGLGSLIAGEGAALPGGPGPGFHFPNGFAPGASFCLPQSQSPGFHVPAHDH